MDNFGDKVLQKIKKECICPKPRWQFLLKDCFVWFVFLMSLLLGSIAFCVMLHVLFTNDWDLYQYLHTSFVGHILVSIPYLWLVFLALFVFIAYYNFKYTKSGYRHETYFIVGLSIVGSMILGTFLHTLGAGEKIEDFVAESVPEYENIVCCSARKDVWVQPARGLLAGRIISVRDDRNFALKDFAGFSWQIQENDDTLEYDPLQIQPGEDVKVIGEKKMDFVFWAREIRPWKNKGDAHKAKVRFEIE
jgi:hypothetical protein